VRSGRDFHQAGRRGKSNHRWPRIGVRGAVIVGSKLGIVINQLSLITKLSCQASNRSISVIPAKAGIQNRLLYQNDLDTETPGFLLPQE